MKSVRGEFLLNSNKAKFSKGDNVRIINTKEIGTINDLLPGRNSVGYRVTVNGKVLVYQEKYLELYRDHEQEIMEQVMLNNYVGEKQFELFNAWYRNNRHIDGDFLSYLSSKTIFNPFQFKPLTKFVSPNSDERLFIADEVGVGKTIETGIILTELLARERINRNDNILIVCPNTLGPKWVKEMKERFNLDFFLHNGSTLRNTLIHAINGTIPNHERFSIVSLQLLRNETYLTLLEELNAKKQGFTWSMVIIDEAHHMRNRNTLNNQLGHLLSSMTDMMIMLSATPLNLRDTDLFNLMNILNPNLYSDQQLFELLLEPVKLVNKLRSLTIENKPENRRNIINIFEQLNNTSLALAIQNNELLQNYKIQLLNEEEISIEQIAQYERIISILNPLDLSFTRTLKREAFEKNALREVIKIPVQLTEEEKEFHDEVIRFSEEFYTLQGGENSSLGFVSNVPKRMVSSSIPASLQYFKWCLQNGKYISEETNVKSSEIANIDNYTIGFDFEIDEDESAFAEKTLSNDIKTSFETLLEKGERLRNIDSKYSAFKQFLQQLFDKMENPQIVVFSFFIRTLEYLKERLEQDGYKVGVISGHSSLQLRYETISDLENKKIEILLASDVGGEGLDFQFCQAILNYDMPYNPMRVEQRIGRIDRFGQKSEKVIAASMYIKDTVDERIYELLYERINLVQESVGLIEPIINNELINLQKDILNESLTGQQLEESVNRIKLAMQKAKIEADHFEKERNQLIGDNDFNQLFAGNHQEDGVLKPMDTVLLSKIFIEQYPNSYFQILDESKALIKLDNSLKRKLEGYTRLPGSEGAFTELAQLFQSNKIVQLVFDGSKAVDLTDHLFLPPTGFWTKFILKELEIDNNISKFFVMKSSSEKINLARGRYFTPFFEIEVEGLTKQVHIASVPISTENMKSILSLDFIKFSRVIQNIEFSDYDIEEIDYDINELLNKARSTLEDFMNHRVDRMNSENQSVSYVRAHALEKGSLKRIDKLTKRIEDHKDKCLKNRVTINNDYIRLIEAQITNERRRTEEKVNSIKDKSNVGFNTKLIAIVDLHVE
ncbi:DEAD/DEAH box helicase [Bacillus rhizoplanae]|uniref:DEAD/DEAH box helicase n=1 Tax=Bacillus rhizoplanae TaxID=2880966 RepID=UPI003D250F40